MVTMARKRKNVSYDDFKSKPDETMILLSNMKNDGRSWRDIEAEFDYQFSHNLIRKVALGECKSNLLSVALGVSEAPKTVNIEPCSECGEVHKLKHCNKKRPAISVDRMAARLSREDGNKARKIIHDLGFNSITDFWLDLIDHDENWNASDFADF